MFTGIIQAVGKVTDIRRRGGDLRLAIQSADFDFSMVELGDSIAINGVCLTVVEHENDWFAADVSNETLSKTSLGALSRDSRVNLESALALGEKLGGHLVSGHVDGLAEVVSMSEDARSWRFGFRVPDTLSRYVAAKGSVCLDGVSLTVNGVSGNEFDVNIIPHTMEQTIFSNYEIGSRVNFEIDLIARYLERLIQSQGDIMSNSLSLTDIERAGFGNADTEE